MKKTLVAIVAVGALAAAITAPDPAQAWHRHGHYGAAVAAGVVGGIAAGALIAGAPVYAYPTYAPAPGYVVYSNYSAPYPVACPSGYWARKPVAFDRAGRPVAWSQPRFVCPAY